MSESEFSLVLDKLKGVTEYIYYHLMGEPLTHPELPKLIRMAGERGYRSIITTNGDAYLANGTIEANKANSDGGAVTVAGGSLEIHDLYIANNQADGHGGAIRNKSESATVKVYDTNFANNTANGDGGAASIHGKNEFHNCKFYGNTAGNKGGALDITGSSKTTF